MARIQFFSFFSSFQSSRLVLWPGKWNRDSNLDILFHSLQMVRWCFVSMLVLLLISLCLAGAPWNQNSACIESRMLITCHTWFHAEKKSTIEIFKIHIYRCLSVPASPRCAIHFYHWLHQWRLCRNNHRGWWPRDRRHRIVSFFLSKNCSFIIFPLFSVPERECESNYCAKGSGCKLHWAPLAKRWDPVCTWDTIDFTPQKYSEWIQIGIDEKKGHLFISMWSYAFSSCDSIMSSPLSRQ